MPLKRKRILLIIGIIIICVALVIVVRSYFFGYLETSLQEKLSSLNHQGYSIRYDSIDVDWNEGVLVIKKLLIQKSEYDTTCAQREFLAANSLRAEGFNVQDIIVNRELNFKTITFVEPHIVLRKDSRLFLRDSALSKTKGIMFSATETRLVSARIQYLDTACNEISDITSGFHISGLNINIGENSQLEITAQAVRLENTKVQLPQKSYTLLIKRVNVNLARKTFDLDTLEITPHYSKFTFGKKKGHEVDRVEGTIPFINLAGFDLQYHDTVMIKSTTANIQMFLKVFRNKRLPFKNVRKPLPLQFAQQLPFGLHIDTVHIAKSYIEYEELTDESDTPGKVYFDDVEAVIQHVDNGDRVEHKTIMHAKAEFMGQGDLTVRTEYPWGDSKKCLVTGALRKIPLTKVNSMIEPAANMKAESGTLEAMTFRFAYNGTRADGELELNYSNLKLISYKDEEKLSKREKRKRKGRGQKDSFKTFILNTFVIRKNMDEKIPEEKRTGIIAFYRDTNRSVFNYWWKSLLSGLREAFHMDKYNERDNKKNLKKQRHQNNAAQ